MPTVPILKNFFMIQIFQNVEDDHAVKRSLTELITPTGYVRLEVRDVGFWIMIFIMGYGVFNSFILFQKPACILMSGNSFFVELVFF